MSTPLFFQPAASTYQVKVVANRPVKHRGKLARTFSRFKGWAKRGLMALIVMMFVLLGSLALPSSAHADPISDAMKNMFCSASYEGVEPKAPFAVLKPDTTGNYKPSETQYTIYEKYRGIAPNFTTWIGPEKQEHLDGNGDFAGRKLVNMAMNDNISSWGDGTKPKDHPGFFNADQTCGRPYELGMSSVANFMMGVTSFVVSVSNMIFSITFEHASNVIATFHPVLVQLISSLKDALYLEFLTPIIMLGALWLGYKGLVKKESTQTAQGALWMFGSAIVGFALLANPLFIPSVVDKVSGAVGQAVITKTMKAGLASADKAGNICDVPEIEIAGTNSETRQVMRQFHCHLYYNIELNPWALGQFGAPLTADPETDTTGAASFKGGNQGIGKDVLPGYDAYQVMLGNVPYSKKSWAMIQADNTIQWDGSNTSLQRKMALQVAANQTYGPVINTDWRGNNVENRVMLATTSLIGAISVGFVVVVFGFAIILTQVVMMILTMLLPLFMLVAVHPGFGRSMAMNYFKLIVATGLDRIINGILEAISITMLVFFLTAEGVDFMTKLIMIVMLTYGILALRPKIIAMARNGLGSNSMGTAAGQLGQNAQDRLTGAAKKSTHVLAGAVGGGFGARQAIRDAAKSSRPHASSSSSESSGGAGERKKSLNLPAEAKADSSAQEASDSGNGAGSSKNSPMFDIAPESNDSGWDDAPETTGAGERPHTAPEADSPADMTPTVDEGGAGERPKGLPDLPSAAEEKIERATIQVHTKEKRPNLLAATAKGAYAARNAGSVAGAFSAGSAVGRAKAGEYTSFNAKRKAEMEELEKQIDADYQARLRKQSADKAKRERSKEQAKRLREAADAKKEKEGSKPAGTGTRPPKPTTPPPMGTNGSGAGGRSK